MPNEWEKQIGSLKEAGFSDSEIAQEQNRLNNEMFNNGFSQSDINDYFGVKTPDMGPTKKFFEENLKGIMAAGPQGEPAENQKGIMAAGPQGTPTGQSGAVTFLDALKAGFQQSASGYVSRNAKPDLFVPEDQGTFYKILEGAGSMAGDLPFNIAGGLGGLAASGGNPVAGGAGAFALPAGLRKIYTEHLEKGDITSAQDFLERASSVFLETAKGAITGAATVFTGGKVGAAALEAGAKPLAASLTAAASEVATMVSVSKGLEGQLPQPEDFIVPAILVGGFHAATGVSSKLRTTFAETGLRPEQVAEEANINPTVKQDLLSENRQVPSAFQNLMSSEKGAVSIPEPKPAPEPPPRTEAEQKILSKIGEKQEVKKSYTFNDFYKDYVDRLNPVNEAIKQLGYDPEKINTSENPYKLARMVSDSKAKSKVFFENGTLDFKSLAKNGEGLQQILEPHKDDIQGLDLYLTSARALEIENKGLQSGFDVDAAREVLKTGKEKYKQTAERIYAFQNRVLEYVKDSGIISEDAYNEIRTNNLSYVPYARLTPIEEINSGSTGKKGTSSLKRQVGSDKAIQSPLLSIFENTKKLIEASEKNRATKALVDLADKTPGQSLFEKVPSSTKEIKISAEELQNALDKQGVETDQNVDGISIFRKNQKNALTKNQFDYIDDGKRIVVKTEPQIAEAIKSLDGNPGAQNLVVKVAQGITRIKKIGTTFTPDFIIKNLFRDQLTAGTFSKGGSTPFLDIPAALSDRLAEGDVYYNWLKSGGANGAFLELNENYLRDNIFKLEKETGIAGSVFNVLKKPVDFIKVAGEMAENATRIAEFKGITKGATEGDKIFEGGFGSREVSLDFQRMGAKIAAFNAITAFQNVSIQGVDKTVRAFKEDPKGTSFKAATYITVPSLALWFANKDDERYKALPNWQKDLFWIIPTDNWQKIKDQKELSGLPDYLVRKNGDSTEVNRGSIYRIPKPQELGLLFGTLPVRVLEKFVADNPRAGKDLQNTIFGLVAPSFLPDAISPALEQFANKSTFTGAPIVSAPNEKLLSYLQYNDYTTETAKLLGKFAMRVGGDNIGPDNLPISSPSVIENYVRGWSGSLGMYALQAMDKALTASGVVKTPPPPLSTLSDMPIIKSFVVRFPSAGAQPIIDFRDEYTQAEKYLNSSKLLAKTGKIDEATKLLTENQDKIYQLKEIHDAHANLNTAIHMVNSMENMSPADKRQAIDGFYFQMLESAKTGLKIIDQLRLKK